MLSDLTDFPIDTPALTSPEVSVVVPCYRCALYLKELHQRLSASLERLGQSLEIILVNDGSPENDWEVIAELCRADPRVVGIELSRNFGQHYAIAAGLQATRGEWVVVMDGDLQDQPEDIIPMVQLAQSGFDSVLGQRAARQDSFFRKSMSNLFYWLLSYLTDTTQDSRIGNFGVYHRKVIDSIVQMPERLRYFPVMVRWVGFKTTTYAVHHKPRIGSRSSYTMARMIALAVDIMIAFSDKPLRLVTQLGILLSLTSTLAGFYVIWRYLVGKVAVQGWASLVVTMSFLGGLTIFLLGVVGIYVGKVFDETKRRPIYIIRQQVDRR